MNRTLRTIGGLLVVALVAHFVRAKIAADGLWTGHDFYHIAGQYAIKNGQLKWLADSRRRQVESATMLPLEQVKSGDIYDLPNIKLIDSIIGAEEWDNLFPRRIPRYTYDKFLHAVAQYPAFCNEFQVKDANLRDQEVACKRELSTLFAHMIFESGHYKIEVDDISLEPGGSHYGNGLRFTREPVCYYEADLAKPSC